MREELDSKSSEYSQLRARLDAAEAARDDAIGKAQRLCGPHNWTLKEIIVDAGQTP